MRKFFHVLGHNKHEFLISIIVVLFGTFLMFAIMPPRAIESHTPRFYYENYGATRLAGIFVADVIGLFCSLNALRDENATQTERRRILIWTWILSIWTSGLLLFLISWWQELDTFLKPSWFQGG